MIDDAADLELALVRWGRAFGTAPDEHQPHRGDTPAVHALAVAMQFAPGKKDKRRARTRDGSSRRALMGDAAGLNGLAPTWSCDPIRGSQTRGSARRHYPDPVADVVDRAVADLYRWSPLMAVCIRLEYCAGGNQAGKAERAAEILDRPVLLKRYRDEVNAARIWLAGHLRGGVT